MKLSVDKNSVGIRIKNIRLKLSDTLEQFGARFNADKSNILRWEQGKTLPNKQRLTAIASLGDITLNELLYGSIDEFLDNNIEGLLMSSKYPYKEISTKSLVNATKEHIKQTSEFNNNIVTVNELDKIQSAFNNALSDVIQGIIDKYNRIKDIILENKSVAEKVLYNYFFDKSDIFNKQTPVYERKIEFMKYAFPYDVLIEFIESNDIENKIKFSSDIEDINELIQKELAGYYLTVKKTLATFSLERLISVNIENGESLHPYIHFSQGSDYTIIELKKNKYNIEGFKRVTGIMVDEENTLYYLAHYKSIDRVPLNTEADYFILNHDNTYQITKITEIPDCKYIAPIIGRLE